MKTDIRHIILLLSICFAAVCPLQSISASVYSEDDEEFDPVLPPDPGSGYILLLHASPADAAVSLTGAGAYQSGAQVAVSTVADEDYTFLQWTCDGEVLSTDAAFHYTMPAAHCTLVAEFARRPQYALSLTAQPASAAILSGAGTYRAGDAVSIACSLAADYIFLHWEEGGIVVSTDTAFVYTMPDAACTLHAVCKYEPRRTITAAPDDALAGSVSILPQATRDAQYPVGTLLHLEAAANADYLFSHWTINGTLFTNKPAFDYTVGMQDAAFVAVFDYNPEQPDDPATNIKNTVRLECIPAGAATFNYGPAIEYAEGTPLSLCATTQSGYRPDGWYIGETRLPFQTTDGQRVTLSYTVTNTASVTLTYRATEIIRSQLYLESSPSGAVSFNTSSGGIYETGTLLTLRAVTAEGYLFDGWYEDGKLLSKNTVLEYTTTEQAVTLTARATKVATDEEGDNEDWDPLPPTDPALETVYIIALSEDNNKGRAYGSASYVVGKEAVLRAVPNTGYTFSHWSDGATDSVRTLTVSAAGTYTAYFTPKQYHVTVESSNEAYGTVSGGGIYSYHSSATLTAVPADGCVFVRWSDDSLEPVHNIYVISDTTLTAYFAPPTCHAAADVYPATAGSVSGTGDYEKGSEVTLRAQAADDYDFLRWSDGDISNPRTFRLAKDTVFTAQFVHQAALSSIACDGVPIATFDPSVLEYTVTLPATYDGLPVISASARHADSRLVMIQATTLPGQASVVVIAKSGAVQTYSVNFVRALSSDATLNSLTYNGQSVPNFKPTRLVYDVVLPSTTGTAPTISAIATDPLARVVVVQTPVFPGQASVVVVSADGSNSLTYTVRFERGQSNDAALSTLTYDGESVPNFSADELNYFVALNSSTTLPWVDATARDETATVDITQANTLPGECVVRVTAEDGTILTYTIYFSVSSPPTGLKDVQDNSTTIQKVIVRGQVFILRGKEMYSILGEKTGL